MMLPLTFLQFLLQITESSKIIFWMHNSQTKIATLRNLLLEAKKFSLYDPSSILNWAPAYTPYAGKLLRAWSVQGLFCWHRFLRIILPLNTKSLFSGHAFFLEIYTATENMYSSQVCCEARLKIKLIKFVHWYVSFPLVWSEIYFLINLELWS